MGTAVDGGALSAFGGDMTSEGSGGVSAEVSGNPPVGNASGIVHALTPKGRRRGEPPFFLISAVIVLLAGAGGWFYFHPPTAPGERPWVLPPGLPSMSEALVCQRDGDIPCAEADLVAYTKKYPTDAHAFAMLAIILTQDGRHKEALYYYQQAEKLGIGTYDLDAGYAKSLDATGHIDAAMAKNRAALDIYPTLVDVRGLLADELVHKGRPKEALELLESFDSQLEAEGQPAYFEAQVRQIKTNLGGDYAKEVATETAEDNGAAPAAVPGETLIKGEPFQGTLLVQVAVDGAKARGFMVDSGASLVSLPYDSAQSYFTSGLIRPGDLRGAGFVHLANGSVAPARLYNLRSIKVGGREVRNVSAAIYNGSGPCLLGQSFLKRFKSWSIDNHQHALVLTD